MNKYIYLTLRHKWFVFVIGLKLKVPVWQLIKHDWTKFFLWKPYSNYFHGDKSMDYEFSQAWLYHQNHEPHHWEYWMPRTTHMAMNDKMTRPEPIEMPEKYVREMVADWMGASKAYSSGGKYPDVDNWVWFEANRERIYKNLHPKTIKLVGKILYELRN